MFEWSFLFIENDKDTNKTFNTHIYISSMLEFLSRVVLQPLCPDHQLLSALLQGLLQDTAAAFPPQPTSRNTSTDRFESSFPVVLLSSKVYDPHSCALLFLTFESRRILTGHVFVLSTLPNAVTNLIAAAAGLPDDQILIFGITIVIPWSVKRCVCAK